MINFEQGEMQAALSQLDQAISNHGQWFDAITRTLICRLPYDRRDVAKDAHRQCLFGQWYYSADSKLNKHPGFAAVESEHKRSHQLAAGLLQSAASGGTIATLDFDNFANSLQRLRLQLYSLKRELEDALYNLDTLTGAISRIGMLTKLREQQDLVKRNVQSCCIAMMDLDEFKLVNDRHGHAAGDKVLAAVTRQVMQHIRPYDKLFRYGGEEFLLCMPGTEVQAGYEIAERMRLRIAELGADYDGKHKIHTTLSLGLTMLDPDVSVEQSIERADKAMYAAKSAGRNCVRIWDPSM
ncbi:MAG: diguanylate cyclase [Pseudomonadota bacterium]